MKRMMILGTMLLAILPARFVRSQGSSEVPPYIQADRIQRMARAQEVVIVCPLYSVGAGVFSELYLMNLFAEPITTDVTAIDSGGESYLLGVHEIDPQSHILLDLSSLLISAPESFSQGVVRVQFSGDADMLQAWTVVGHQGAWSEMPCGPPKTFSKLGVLWPRQDATAVDSSETHLYLFNAGDHSSHYRVHSGRDSEQGSLLPGHRHHLVFSASDAESAEVTFEGRSQISAGAMLVSKKSILRLPVQDSGGGSSRQESLPFLWPSSDQPVRLALWNRARKSIQLIVTITDVDFNESVGQISLDLGLDQAVTLDLGESLGTVARALAGGTARVSTVSTDPDVLVAGSISRSSETVDGILFFPYPSAHDAGAYPIPDLELFDVTTTLLNVGIESSTVLAQLYWTGGSYALLPLELPPGTAQTISFDSLVEAARPDLLGRIIPRKTSGAYFRWTVARGGVELLARTNVRQRGATRGFGFNCSGFCCPESTGIDLLPRQVVFPAGGSGSFQACEYVYSCDGTMGPFPPINPTYSYSSPFSWNGSKVSSGQPAAQTLSFSFEGYLEDDYHCQRRTITMLDSGPAVAAKVAVLSADLTTNKIRVDLKPGGQSGNLKVYLKGANIRILANSNYSSGTYTLTFGNLSAYAKGESFDTVIAEWTVNGKTVSSSLGYRFDALGSYLHTRYNTPTESACAGAATDFCYFTGDCKNVSCSLFNHSSGKAGWVSEVNENGSGFHSTLGYMSLEGFCSLPGGCNMKFRKVPSPCPQCSNLGLGPNATVAIHPMNPFLKCGDRVFIVGVGSRIVTDHGGGLTLSQLDHYAGVSGCNSAGGTIGNAPTFKLY